MERIYTEFESFSQWPTSQRVAAVQALVPKAVLRDVLKETATPSRYCRRLPNWFLLWFMVGLGLFCRDSYRQIFRWLQPFRRTPAPGRSTLCMARQRLGIAPLRRLRERLATLLARPGTRGAFYRGYRLMAIDSFVVDLADSADNGRVFGRPGSGRAKAAQPQARVVSLCELGTHLLWQNVIKPCRCGETTVASALLRHLAARRRLVVPSLSVA